MIRLVPDPFETESEYRRFYHEDIADLKDADIIDELHALRPLLWWRLPGDEWLRERARVLEIELKRRRVGVRNGMW